MMVRIASDIWKELLPYVKKYSLKVLLFDYDGTLVPYTERPVDAVLDEEVLQMLKDLSVQKDLEIVIISGRSLHGIKDLVHLPGVSYITNHGFLIEFDGKLARFDNNFNTEENYLARYRIISKYLSKKYKEIDIEKKEVTTAFHYHNVDPALHRICKEDITGFIKQYFGPKEIRIIEGHKAVEIFPARSLSHDMGFGTEVNKGTSIRFLLTKLAQKYGVDDLFTFFVGDDATDEKGFDFLNSVGKFSIKVGSGDTCAGYRLDSVTGVHLLLQDIYNYFISTSFL